MDCQFTENVSLLIDGELESDAAMRLNEHLATCAICQEAQADFLRLRDSLKGYQPVSSPFAQSTALRTVLGSARVPFWKRRVPVPAPVFVLLLLALLSLGVWRAGTRGVRTPPTAGNQGRKPPIPQAPAGPAGGGLDLARFDHGARAVIYKARQTKAGDVQE